MSLLAWTLALLILPALASACTGFLPTNTWTGAVNSDWTNAANWGAAGVPTATALVCIPAGTPAAIVNTPAAVASAIEVENLASLAVASLQTLTVSPSVGPNQSAIHGDVTINGGSTLAFKSMNVVYDGGGVFFNGGGTLDLDGNTFFSITNSMDLTDLGGGASQVTNAGTFNTASKDPDPVSDPVMIGPALVNNGAVRNANGSLRLLGGGSGTGSWSPGSDGVLEQARLELFGPQNYTFDGPVSDVDAGGVGHVLVSGTNLNMSNPASAIDVYELTVDAPAGGLDFTGTSMNTKNFTLKSGLVDSSAVSPQSFGTLTVRGGQMVGIGEWSANFFHFGGGALESGGSQALTVGTLDMSVNAGLGDTGTRGTVQRDLIVTGAGTQDYPYDTGTFDLAGNSDMTIGPGVRFVMGNDVDIGRSTGAGTIIVHGTLDKLTAEGTSAIAPDINNPDGTVKVSQGTLDLVVPPIQYDGVNDTLTAGTWIMAGTLRFPGVMGSLSSGLQFLGGHLLDTGTGFDALTTATRNASGNAITLASGSQIAPGAGVDFTNGGTINLSGTSSVSLTGGGNFIQATAGASINLTQAASHLDVGAGGVASFALGTLGGIGTVNGDVQNTGGTVSPGNSPGTLTINGHITPNGPGVFLEEINGSAAGQFDQLIVTGTATLGGTMILQSSGGYVPPAGQSFDAITAANRVGAFGGLVQSGFWPHMDENYGAGATPALRLTANNVSVGDASVAEGSFGTSLATFAITLASAAPQTVSVDWATQDGTATAGSDYVATGGTVTFAPGETSKSVTVPVNGDTTVEPAENFAVNLSNPGNTAIGDGQGVGTISADDGPPVATAAAVPADDIDGLPVPPPPVQGKKVNVLPVSGKVLVKLPRTTKFVRLPDAEQVPVGTIVDARNGVVRLYSAGKGGKVQSSLFYEGVFQVLQKVGQALTQAMLVGGSFVSCPKPASVRAATKRKQTASVRHLWGSGSGQFQTVGRFASATIRGTKWLTDDRCNGTLIRVTVGAVTVRDLTLKKALVVKKPKSYLAPAVKPRRR